MSRSRKHTEEISHVVLLECGGLVEGSEDFIKEAEGALGPDNETSEMSSRGELEEVQSPDVDELNTGQVAESLDNTVVLIVDDKRTTALTMSAVPEFSFAGTDFAGVGNLDDISVGVEGLEESDGLLGLGEGLSGILNNKGNFLDFLDAVTTGENERGESRGSKGRNNSKAALVLVDLDVPFAPSLGRGEHASTTAHVTEGSLKINLVFQRMDNFLENSRRTCPDRWVPPPPTRGIRATARPVPQDSALVWCPAFSLTEYACLLFFAMLSVYSFRILPRH